MGGGRTPGQPFRMGWFVAVTKQRDEDPVRGERGVPSKVHVQGRENGNEMTTFQQCRPYRTVSQGDSAIPGSRASRASTSMIARDCH